ncbi:hypothetical protein PYCCODRAFT_221620 [Trametes coccinea BRFM310]|uniref:Uncharacterized protein n=1 Tax=Trametes coccinea (strain BRFM310) TaxID=1353009 RepID=A0A1Y2IQU0_TRAC3|nr:hypothetical protein PYCCODRAFT_221620 [Trametes coccinea BRFM310]
MGSNNLAFSTAFASRAEPDAELLEAHNLSLKARQLDARGHYQEAERLLLRALEVIESQTSTSNATVAALWNSLGEIYLHMGRLDDAERWLNKSLDVSVALRDFKEITTTRENLARVSQARSELLKAKALRMLGAPDDMRCGNNGCRRGLLRSPDLRICGGWCFLLFWRMPAT